MPATTLPTYTADELEDLLHLAVRRRDAALLLLTVHRAAAASVDLGEVRQDLEAAPDLFWLAQTLSDGAMGRI